MSSITPPARPARPTRPTRPSRPSRPPVPLVPELENPLPRLGADEGLLAWIASVDHKQIGIMYILSAFAFFLVGGLEALLIRWQLAAPNNVILNAATYNQVFTMHGTTMVFLAIMPMLFGFAVYFVPLQIGARDMAFPRLNSFGFWAFLFGGVMMYYSFVAGNAPDMGWYGYAPLSEWQYSSNVGVTYWALGLLVTGLGSVATGVNIIATILTLRAPGVTLRRLPLFTWMSLFQAALVLAALPALNASLVMLLADRLLGAHFFDTTRGGNAVLWQHAFWSFGHPEVYILILPGWGIVSEVIPVFSRKPIFGYGFVAGATVAIFFLSLLVWGHHMFTSGMGSTLNSAFGLASLLIAVPTGVKVFNWTATTWKGSLRLTTSMLFALAFIPQFVLGGLSGVSFAAFPVDWQTKDSYYLVAHIHYVLMGGTAFTLLSGIYYWFPKMTGRMLSERLGKINFWLTFTGFNVTFFIQHFLGLDGMPRRVYTYPDYAGWQPMNLISSFGAVILALGMLALVVNLVYSVRHGAVAGDNPWHAWTLEWATTSPPPHYNFDQVPPVRGRRPLWDLEYPDKADARQRREARGQVEPESYASPV